MGFRRSSQPVDFFISYSNKDMEKVENLVSKLKEKYGARCWFQKHDSRNTYVEEIIKGIDSATVFIVFISKHSATSYNVLNEISYALELASNNNEGLQILPVILEDGEFDIKEDYCKNIRFQLNRFNMLSFDLRHDLDFEVIIGEIFEQTGYEVPDKLITDSCYQRSEIEKIRLRGQNEILKGQTNYIFEELLKPDAIILDVGCASGDNIMMRLENLEYKCLLGVDKDQNNINEAINSYGNAKNTFVCCDVLDDNFYDTLDNYLENLSLGFDVIHISSVLLHNSKPMQILKNLRKYLKRDGAIFIQEEDDAANIAYPRTDFFEKAYAIWFDSNESGDRYCARKIPTYLREAGYKDIQLKKCGISNIDLQPQEQLPFWDIYFNYHLWDALERNVFNNYAKTKKMIDEYIAEYENVFSEYKTGKIFVQLGFFYFVAKR